MTLEETNKALEKKFTDIGTKVNKLNELLAVKDMKHSLTQMEQVLKEGLEEIMREIDDILDS